MDGEVCKVCGQPMNMGDHNHGNDAAQGGGAPAGGDMPTNDGAAPMGGSAPMSEKKKPWWKFW